MYEYFFKRLIDHYALIITLMVKYKKEENIEAFKEIVKVGVHIADILEMDLLEDFNHAKKNSRKNIFDKAKLMP